MGKNVEEMDGDDDNEEDPLGFPIEDIDINVHMKNIHPYVFCRYYNYLIDTQKLKLFPVTLKDKTLQWFMGLGTNSIRSWHDMRTLFLEK